MCHMIHSERAHLLQELPHEPKVGEALQSLALIWPTVAIVQVSNGANCTMQQRVPQQHRIADVDTANGNQETPWSVLANSIMSNR